MWVFVQHILSLITAWGLDLVVCTHGQRTRSESCRSGGLTYYAVIISSRWRRSPWQNHLGELPFWYPGSGPPASSLIAHYAFDPSNPLLDASQTLGDLVPSSISPSYQADCPWPTAHCAIFSSSDNSTGGGQFFNVPNINLGAMSAGAGFSICSWFEYSTEGLGSIFDFGNGTMGNILLRSDYTGLQLDVYYDCGEFDSFIFSPISHGQWRHVCIVNQATDWFYYENGMQVGLSSKLCNISDIVLSSNYLARSNLAITGLFQGSISDFRIYNRVLNASEVAALSTNAGSNSLIVSRATFWACWLVSLYLERHTFTQIHKA